jgi:subtilisin family serine protease
LVAVIDSGIDRSHPEFAGAIAAMYNAARDRKFEVDDHGTAVAGIIGARAQLKGVAPATRLLAVRAFFKEGKGGPLATTYILLRAINWAQKNNARLINLSFAGPHDEALKRIVNEAYQRGTILVAAAGNGGPNAPAAYPAAYPGVLAITATDQDDNIYQDANRGGYVAIAAPGVDILVPVLDSGYDFKSGTSFAAAHVTGLIALMLERNPELSPDEVREILAGAAVDLGPRGPDKQFGAGRADAFIAIQAVVNGRRARRN